MAVTSSRRDVLHFGYGAAATLGVSALAPVGALEPERALAQGAPASDASTEGSASLGASPKPPC